MASHWLQEDDAALELVCELRSPTLRLLEQLSAMREPAPAQGPRKLAPGADV